MIVMEMTTSAGVRVAFDDSAYRGCTPAEIEARIAHARQTAWWCAARAQERRAKQNAPEVAALEDVQPGAASAFAAPDMRVTKESITQRRGDCNGNTAGILGSAAVAGAL